MTEADSQLTVRCLGPRLSSMIFSTYPRPSGGAQVKVAVALAGQSTDRSEEPVGVAQDALGLRGGEYRRRSPKG